MAQFELWIGGLLGAEGGFAAEDNGLGAVNYGITEAFLKDHGIDIDNNGVINAQDLVAMTPEKASALYRKFFWDLMRLGELEDQSLANLLGHLGVNQGTGTAAVHLQHAVETQGAANVTVDGIIGSVTLGAANHYPVRVTRALVKFGALLYYVELAVKNPKKYGDDLPGWFHRLETL